MDINDELNRAIFVGLVLQTGLTQSQLAKWTTATNGGVVDRDFCRKLKNPHSTAFRRWSKSDLLFLQSLILMKEAGFDISNVEFADSKLISSINHPDIGKVSFTTIDTNEIKFDKLFDRKPSEFFSMSDSEKLEFINKARLICKKD